MDAEVAVSGEAGEDRLGQRAHPELDHVPVLDDGGRDPLGLVLEPVAGGRPR